jgi:hypothetical protein
MHDEAELALMRYEAMADMLGGVPDAVIALAESDRAVFGERYLLPKDADGVPVISNVLRVRFMVEVCGLTYEESVAAIAEREPIDNADWLDTMRGPEEWARRLMTPPNIAEAIIDMEIVKAMAAGFPEAVEKIDVAIAALKGMRFAPPYEGKEWEDGG